MPEALPRLAVEVGPSKVEASGVPEQTIEARSARGRGAETSLAALIKALEGSKTELEGAAAAATETAHATRDAIIAAANARCAALVAAIEVRATSLRPRSHGHHLSCCRLNSRTRQLR